MVKFKKVKVDTEWERKIITGMIVSTPFLRDIRSIYNTTLMDIDYAKIVGRWCLTHYEQFEQSPGKEIQDIYETWSDNPKNEDQEDQVELIGRFLESISDEYERADKFNYRYHLKKAEEYFAKKQLSQTASGINDFLRQGEPEQAMALVTNFNRVELPISTSVDPFNNLDLIYESLSEVNEPLFRMPGAYGKLIDDDLCRGSFIAFLGPEKIGKTWTLMELAIQAARQRNNVAFFQAGDMTDLQQSRRLSVRLTGTPWKEKYCGKFHRPVLDCIKNQLDRCDIDQRKCNVGLFRSSEERKIFFKTIKGESEEDKVDLTELLIEQIDESIEDGYIPCDYCRRGRPNKRKNYKGAVWYEYKTIDKPLNWRDAYKANQKFSKRTKNFRLSTHANGTLSVADIETQLDIWERFEGFTTDIVIADYADIMACQPQDANSQFRHKENGKWQALRALSQKRNCLVITATQADARAYGAQSLNMSNFSEDKRKFAHVTSMFTLQRTRVEKILCQLRIGSLVMRDDDYDFLRHAYVIQSLREGKPCIGSYF